LKLRIPGVSDALQYIHSTVIQEPEGFEWIRERIQATDWPIHIGPEEGRLFQMLMHLGKCKRVLEIGTHAGYSTMWLAHALPEDGTIHTVEREKNRIKMARETFSYFPDYQSKIILLEGSALDVLKTLDHLQFDFIFVDADKLNYLKYFEWADKHLVSGGVFVADNTFLSGAVYEKETTQRVSPSAINAVQELNRTLGGSPHYITTMLPTKEGLTIGIKR
jgi:caffeoyl-CoA O-methyltransferase